MDVKTLADLIDWTRDLHGELAASLKDSGEAHEEERATELLQYLADHEARIETLVSDFEDQADGKALRTYIYDHMAQKPLKTRRLADEPYSDMTVDQITREILDVHEQVMNMYSSLISRAEIPEARDLLESVLEMEKSEAKRLSAQTGRMDGM